MLLKFFVCFILAVLPIQAAPLQPYTAQALQAAQQNNHIIVLHFSRSGCNPCKFQQIFLEKLEFSPQPSSCCSDISEEVVFFQVDVDDADSLELMSQYNVAASSFLVVLKGKEPVDTAVGVTSEEDLLKFVNDSTNLQFRIKP